LRITGWIRRRLLPPEEPLGTIRLHGVLRGDPVLPGNVLGHFGLCRCERVESADSHLVDNENGGKRRISVVDVESDEFAVVAPEASAIRIVDKHELALLLRVKRHSEEDDDESGLTSGR
jgi:hypothetical protein